MCGLYYAKIKKNNNVVQYTMKFALVCSLFNESCKRCNEVVSLVSVSSFVKLKLYAAEAVSWLLECAFIRWLLTAG